MKIKKISRPECFVAKVAGVSESLYMCFYLVSNVPQCFWTFPTFSTTECSIFMLTIFASSLSHAWNSWPFANWLVDTISWQLIWIPFARIWRRSCPSSTSRRHQAWSWWMTFLSLLIMVVPRTWPFHPWCLGWIHPLSLSFLGWTTSSRSDQWQREPELRQ